ncbi:MAG: tetratricopeptide repeat protein [Acidobacteria bacterium]|nr:tetratricopeptide repeat protein [Acidobacteriota bacterium]
MPTFYDSKGQSYTLTNQLGRGGEGTVFACPDDYNLVAKIYHEPIDDEKAEKLAWMAANKNEQLLKVAAWIVDTLHDRPGGRVVGFLMPNVRAKEIHELYSLKSRRVHFPEATWKFLLHTAANVARAFYSLHKYSHIMGDVNHGNCVVLKDGTVKLIDCDSYSISTGEFRYRCEVGVATHLAPELQGKDLSEVERKNAHDNFGLAVIIFQLLFLGRHPFAGNYLGDEDKSLEDCIRERRFAYSKDAHLWRVKQPPGTLSLSAVTPRLGAMFERAFLTEDRPEPREWIEALEDLSESLKQCALHVGHYYYQELRQCPWCALESQTGLMLFPFVNSAGAGSSEAFNIFTIENLVASLAVPSNLPMKPPKTAILPPPSPEAETARRENLSRFVILAIVQLCVVVFLTAIGGPGVGFFIGALLMVGFIVSLNNAGKDNKIDLEVRLENARREWNQLETEWSRSDANGFDHDFTLIRQKIDEHHHLQQDSRKRLKKLHDDVFQYNLDMYLASFKIGDAKFPGVGVRTIEMLKGGGIRTAADVDAKRLDSLPPVEGDIKDRLVEWRKNLERNFAYDPDTGIPEGEQQKLTGEFVEKRGRLEREIENLLVSLRSGSTLVRQRQQHLTTRAETVAKQLLQSESDIATAGSITAPVVVLILITTLVPMFGNIFSIRNEVTSHSIKPAIEIAANTAQPMSTKTPSNANVYAYYVPENLTDADIAKLSTAEKNSYAQQLLDRATQLAGVNKDYKKAEDRLQLALKLTPENTKVLNKLGDLLYDQKKYKESLVYLNRSLLLYSSSTETKFAIGMNYLQMNYFDDARRIFADLVAGDPSNFEAQFNLGMAYKGLGQYYPAVNALKAALQINDRDGDTHYLYAVCLNKIGSQDEVVAQYQKLLEIDPKAAERLRKDLGLKNVPKAAANKTGVGNGRGGYADNTVTIRESSGRGRGN